MQRFKIKNKTKKGAIIWNDLVITHHMYLSTHPIIIKGNKCIQFDTHPTICEYSSTFLGSFLIIIFVDPSPSSRALFPGVASHISHARTSHQVTLCWLPCAPSAPRTSLSLALPVSNQIRKTAPRSSVFELSLHLHLCATSSTLTELHPAKGNAGHVETNGKIQFI